MSDSKKDNSASFSYVDNLVGNEVVPTDTNVLSKKLLKFTKKLKQRKSVKQNVIIKFQKKVINKYLALLTKKEFTTKFERETLKIVEFELKKNKNELILGTLFRNIYFKINPIELRKRRFSKKKKAVQVYRGDLMKDYLELSRNILRIACCVLEKKNLKGILSFKSPRKKADYQLIDIIDLANLILYSLTEPIEMLRVIKEVQKKTLRN